MIPSENIKLKFALNFEKYSEFRFPAWNDPRIKSSPVFHHLEIKTLKLIKKLEYELDKNPRLARLGNLKE